ncbi:MAG: rhombosortase [Nitrospiraceae bacterium]|nr:MAG: rhombosortase [Nitrospiraceae bacterium]
MNTLTLRADERKAGEHMFPFHWKRFDVFIFSLLLIFINTHLITGNYSTTFFFFPDSVHSGEWWRILTHPFVHLSWYHLFLDAGAFFLLYRELHHKRIREKLFYVLMCGAVSLGVAMVTSPLIYTRGLTGLSGIAHGLMAISALEMMREKEHFRTGLIFFLVVVFKSIYETINGDVLFAFMHMGLCGTPVAACHAGGVLGGIVAFLILRYLRLEKN